MAYLRIPDMKKIPDGATRGDRDRMHDEYCAELRRLNPSHFNSDGSFKSVWQWLIDLFSNK